VDVGNEEGWWVNIDTERGAKVSGARFYYLTGIGAQLELALVNLAMEQAEQTGFTPVIAPALVKPEAMEGTGYLGAHASEVYRLADDDLYLVGTSEVALAGYHADEILTDLPLRYAGFSSCFRREAGSYGKDTKGIIRVHWFDKVEMFSYVPVEDSRNEHLRLLAWERQFLDKLELAYRVIDTAAGDLGSSAARKYDLEAWFPSQGTYRELTSTSNTTTFQSRRLNIRTRTDSGTTPVAKTTASTTTAPLAIGTIANSPDRSPVMRRAEVAAATTSINRMKAADSHSDRTTATMTALTTASCTTARTAAVTTPRPTTHPSPPATATQAPTPTSTKRATPRPQPIITVDPMHPPVAVLPTSSPVPS